MDRLITQQSLSQLQKKEPRWNYVIIQRGNLTGTLGAFARGRNYSEAFQNLEATYDDFRQTSPTQEIGICGYESTERNEEGEIIVAIAGNFISTKKLIAK